MQDICDTCKRKACSRDMGTAVKCAIDECENIVMKGAINGNIVCSSCCRDKNICRKCTKEITPS